jgi:hypothetical protein
MVRELGYAASTGGSFAVGAKLAKQPDLAAASTVRLARQ